jgi:hypothetical protein
VSSEKPLAKKKEVTYGYVKLVILPIFLVDDRSTRKKLIEIGPEWKF